MRTRFGLLVCLLLASAARAGDTWPQFRGPDGTGVSDSTGLPVEWSETKNVRWKTAIHGKAWSSPVIWGNQVWMTTAPKDGKEYYAVCVDRKSGKIIHDRKLFTVEKPPFCIEFNSYASSTPVIEPGRLYFHFGSTGTGCLDTKTGDTHWLRQDIKCDHFRGAGSSPIVYKNLLILTFDGADRQFIMALNKTTGDTVWRTDRNIEYGTDNGDLKKAYSTPAVITVNGKPQLVSPAAAATTAYHPETGDVLWRVYHGGMNEASRPVAGHGLIFLNSGHTQSLLAVRQGGSGDITKSHVAWQNSRSAPTRPSMILLGELLFTVNDLGLAACWEAKTGKKVWGPERLAKECSASPVAADGRIYAPDQEGTTSVFAADREFKLLAKNKLDAGCMASPAVAGDAIFLRTKTHLYCLGR